jgi:hypothetical protein
MKDAMELLVPELQRRALIWSDYHVPGGTFRENLHDNPGEPHLGRDHPRFRYKWNKENGGVMERLRQGRRLMAMRRRKIFGIL